MHPDKAANPGLRMLRVRATARVRPANPGHPARLALAANPGHRMAFAPPEPDQAASDLRVLLIREGRLCLLPELVHRIEGNRRRISSLARKSGRAETASAAGLPPRAQRR